ncbi:winged helix-turn-helix transcriptional regulator [Streptomyces jumonjinensis]|uniref:winged helix-turn-helix transcriptional regulator n=1 Tax=Streptomyces jumonjinensis TaxID=1945 RepID=UPI0033263B05
MPTLRTALAGRTESVDHALTALAPRWTTWLLQTLRQQESMRAAEIVAATPWNSHPYTVQLLTRMQERGLVDRLKFGTYGITAAGRAAEPVHRALAAWHRQNLTAVTADAERAEDVLARLRPAGTATTLTVLDRYGPLTPSEVSRETGLHPSSCRARLTRMAQDGLVLRHAIATGTGPGGLFELAPAAEGLGDVYAALASWTPEAEPLEAATRPPVVIRAQAANNEWAAVAVQRAPSVSSIPGLFSHPSAAQPLVSAAVTAISRPPRTC